MATIDPRLVAVKDIIEDDPDEALRLVNDTLNDNFDDPDALFMAGYILMQAERYGMAFNLFERSRQIAPNHTETYNNMGMCVDDSNTQLAIQYFDKALELKPSNASAMINKGLMLMKSGNPEKCIELCLQALRIDPDSRAAHDNLGLAYLMTRQWEKGWAEYQWGLGGKHRKKHDYGVPEWDGKTAGNIIIYGEQGIGDEIMFASCIPDALKHANHVTIDCDSRLEGLFSRSFDCHVSGTRYGGEIDTPVEPDFACSIGDLPRFYRNKHKDFPGTPYLTPDPERCVQWRALLDQYQGMKIGIAWSGGVKNTGSARRSITLDDLAPLFDSGHTFVSLEYNKPDQTELDKYDVKHWHRAVGKGADFDETIALISELDLVISVTTTVIHAAGAIGKECWTLAPMNPPALIHKSGDLPWYKSVKMFRQTTDWAEVIGQVANKLEKTYGCTKEASRQTA